MKHPRNSEPPLAPQAPGRWADSLKQLQDFDTVSVFKAPDAPPLPPRSALFTLQVGGFWDAYCHIVRADKLPARTSVHLFKAGVQPLWEDPKNADGGRLILYTPKTAAVHIWERVLLALVGGAFGPSSASIMGAVLQVREDSDIISVWVDNASNDDAISSIRSAFIGATQLPPHIAATVSFKAHNSKAKKDDGFSRGSRFSAAPGFSRGLPRESSGGSTGSGRGGRGNPAFSKWRGREDRGRDSRGGYDKHAAKSEVSVDDLGSWRRGPSPAPAPAPERASAPAPAAAAEPAPAPTPAPAPAPAPVSRHMRALQRASSDPSVSDDSGGTTPTGRRRRPQGGPARLGADQ